MRLQTLSYHRDGGWTAPTLPPWDSPSTLVLVFAAPSFEAEPALWQQLAEAYPRSHLLGCSTAGEVHGTRVSDDSVAVAVVAFERTALRTAMAPVGPGGDGFAAAREVAHALCEPGLRAVIALCDGRDINGSEVVRGLGSALDPAVVVTGGLAGDGDRFQRTWTLVGAAPRVGFITAVGLYGDAVRVGHGAKGGWDVFGPERVVTRSAGNVLYELDGRPALELYETYLGELAAGLPAAALLFPLLVRDPAAEGRRLVRTILDIDHAAQSMTFAGDVPQGFRAQLMRANLDRLVQGASDAAHLALAEGAPAGELLSIAISCVGRRLVLRQRVEEESEATLEAFPAGTQQIGFYAYGAISPYASGRCELYNQTMALTTVWEE